MVLGGAWTGHPLLSAGLLVIALLAGCADVPQEVEDEGGSTLRTDIVDDGAPANETVAKVTGTVLHASGFPLPGARITILSVENSAVTGADGAFTFAQVPLGKQLLRVEKETYQTLQRSIEVASGKVTKVEVVLVPAHGNDGGFSEHFHDHWRGEQTYTLLQASLEQPGEVDQVPPQTCAILVIYDASCYYLPIQPELGRIVPPGTTKVSIDISFEPGPLFSQEYMYLYVYPPTSADGKFYYFFQGVESGESHFEYELPDPSLVDHGHARWTDWQFQLYWSAAGGGYISGSMYNALFKGPVEITITAHKGDGLALDPPHQRHWKDSDRIVMEGSQQSYAYCSVAAAYSCSPRYPTPYVYANQGETTCYYGCMVPEMGSVVPPGTTRVLFTVEHTWGSATASEAGALMERPEFIIGYKTAAAPARGATWDHYTWLEPGTSEATAEGVAWTYEVPVTEAETDPFYTRLSNWVLMAAVPGHEDDNDWQGMNCGHEACGFAYFRLLEFIAINDDWDEMQAA